MRQRPLVILRTSDDKDSSPEVRGNIRVPLYRLKMLTWCMATACAFPRDIDLRTWTSKTKTHLRHMHRCSQNGLQLTHVGVC
ncbi:hypothetical protein PISMIDRAFT_466874 [Pisolithus microcarpus 441]|uniref:Uncharacterized protein n=1 Tax=Pisolithus microcarpus 441 TaxID=765257 RepID=A0A0C9ZBH1_9AGAM|nr:hypothetical protein PISMIDRAFT_322670 [Pisolithus microcarpus 441]KIK23294.1 hypothetical protein PISMIDRAFT_466874 [Pisolithus microcarpus 441]